MKPAWSQVTADEALEIERLLLAGHSVQEVHRRTGRSATTVRAVRTACGMADSSGRRPTAPPRPPMEGPEGGYEPSGNPCALLYVLRPCQDRWVELLRAADMPRLELMRRAVHRVLGVPYEVAAEALAEAAIEDRRPADQLASAYLAEAGLP